MPADNQINYLIIPQAWAFMGRGRGSRERKEVGHDSILITANSEGTNESVGLWKQPPEITGGDKPL